MMSELLKRGAASSHAEYGTRIARATGRTQRLIGEVFEISRTTAGLGLELSLVPGDLVAFVRTLVHDARLAHPEWAVLFEAPPKLMVFWSRRLRAYATMGEHFLDSVDGALVVVCNATRAQDLIENSSVFQSARSGTTVRASFQGLCLSRPIFPRSMTD